jgi:hypothetical protein
MMADFLSPVFHAPMFDMAAWSSLPIPPHLDWWWVALIAFAWAAIGAALRRMHGGWLALKGGTIRALEIAWMAALWFLWPMSGYDLWGFTVPRLAVALVALALVWLHLVQGVYFSKNVGNGDKALPWSVAKRYALYSAPFAAMTQCWPALLVGPAIALAYKGRAVVGRAGIDAVRHRGPAPG